MFRLEYPIAAAISPLLFWACAAAAAPPLHAFLTVAISPDGRHIASLEGDAPPGGGDVHRRLVLRDAGGGASTTVALPCGDDPQCVPGTPAWSPDSRRIAFTVRQPGGFARTIYTLNADGSGLAPVAAFDGTVVTLRFSPAGALAALAVANANKEAGASQAGAALSGSVGADLREQRIAIVDGDHLRWASPPGLFVYEYDWLPDGSGFVGSAAPGNGDAAWWSAKLYAFDAATGDARVLYAPRMPQEQLAQPRAARDGRSVAFIRGLMSDFATPGGDAMLLPLAPGAEPRNLTSGLDATVTSLAWDCGGGALVAGAVRGGDSAILRIDANGGGVATLWQGARALYASDGALSVACGANTTAAVSESFADAAEIVAGPVGGWHAITNANASAASPAQAIDVHWNNGGHAMQGWLLLPQHDATVPFPLVVVAHGGPAWSYGPAFYAGGTTRALLDAGYAIFQPNPRGSYGQGEAFTQANVRDFGYGDLSDILAGLDAVLALGQPVDPARVGITGVSYGGFMTLWATTQTQRFRAAVARAPISDWQSYYGTNGIGGWLLPYFGASLYDDPTIYARSTPIGFVKAARTPTLLLAGANDIETPPTQAQEFWTALTQLGVATEFYVYADEGHEFRDPAHAADATRRTVAWFDRWLK